VPDFGRWGSPSLGHGFPQPSSKLNQKHRKNSVRKYTRKKKRKKKKKKEQKPKKGSGRQQYKMNRRKKRVCCDIEPNFNPREKNA